MSNSEDNELQLRPSLATTFETETQSLGLVKPNLSVQQIYNCLNEGLIDEAIAAQRSLPTPYSDIAASAYARLRVEIADRLVAQGHVAGVFDLLQPYDTALSRARLPIGDRALVSLRLGEAYCATLNHPSAVSLLDEAIRYAGSASDKGLESKARCCLGLVYSRLGEYIIAREHLSQALKQFNKVADKRGAAQVNLYLGLVSVGLGDFEISIEFFNKSVDLAQQINDKQILTEATANLGSTFLLQGRLRRAIKIFEEIIEGYQQQEHLSLSTRVYSHFAYSLLMCGDWTRAEQLLEKSIGLSREKQDDSGEAMAMAHYGLLYMLTGRNSAAKTTLNFALELAKQIRARDCESFCFINLGKLSMQSGDNKQAITYLKSGFELASVINRYDYALEAEISLLEIALAEDDLKEAELLLHDAQQLSIKLSNPLLEGKVLCAEGQICFSYGDNERMARGIAKFTQAIEIFEIYSAPFEKARAFVKRSRALSKEAETFAKGCVDLERAVYLFEQVGAVDMLAMAQAELKALERHIVKSGTDKSARNRLLEERRQIHRLIKACRNREPVLKEAAQILCRQLQADVAAFYEVNLEGALTLRAANSDIETLKESLERRVSTALKDKKQGWIAGRTMDEQIYLDLFILNPETRLAVVIWGVPRKMVQAELMHAFVEIAGEVAAIAALQEGRRIEIGAREIGQLKSFKGLPDLIYASRKMGELTEQILRIHSSDLTVLITGESGTGKDLVARAIHSVSERRGKPFLPFNCTATPQEVVEAQLFGYRKGAFTGAHIDYEGVIRAVDGGTLLLDEIGDLSLSIQPKLLRFLQDGEIQPIGYSRPIRVNVRVITSTNRDLEKMVERGEFREDLYHRLNIIRLFVPSLRQRREEIVPLAQYFLQQSCQRTGKRLGFSAETLLIMESFDWSGNVRQLKNEIERIVAFAGEADTIEKYHLSPEIVQATANLKWNTPQLKGTALELKPGLTLDEMLAATEKQVITKALKQHRGNIRRTAEMLGISRKGLYDKIKRLKIKYAD